MNTKLTTSVSLPQISVQHWRRHRSQIMAFAGRFLRIQMRSAIRRSVTRSYNRSSGPCVIVTARFTPTEYDTLHYVAASLRVSVSSLVHGIIQLWLKPARRAIRQFIASNYDCNIVKWDPEAGFIEENLVFWRYEPYQNYPATETPPAT